MSSYSAPQDILHKSVEELIQLKEAGLKLLYYGMESGDDIVLRAVKKGVTGEQAVEAGKRVTASGIKLSLMFGTGYYYLYRYALFGFLGLIALVFLGWKINYRVWLKYRTPIFYLFFVLLLCVDLFGITTKGAQRWLVIAGFSFQPSEFVKLAVIIMGAGSLGSLLHKGRVPDLLQFPVNLAFIQSVILAGMVLIQPDMGTAAIILALMIVLYVIAGLPLKELGMLASVCATGVVVMPGLPKRPAAEKIDVDDNGVISGLF